MDNRCIHFIPLAQIYPRQQEPPEKKNQRVKNKARICSVPGSQAFLSLVLITHFQTAAGKSLLKSDGSKTAAREK